MPKVETTYDLLISCPSDVNQFVDIIRECVDDFNRVYGNINNMKIIIKHWLTDSYPQSGDKPQELLNNQIVRNCDAAVAIFWTKFGTPTEKYNSGTEEEIEELLSANKQVFMYFIDAPIEPSSVNMDQYKKVEDFKAKYKDRGYYFTIKNKDEFKKLFTNHLGMYFLPIAIGEKNKVKPNISPILKIKTTSMEENQDAVVEYYNFGESKFLAEKRKDIISKIKSLQKLYLKVRDRESTKSINSLLISDQNLKALKALSGEIKNADIDDIYKNIICKFANENNINIDEAFWNVGNLKKRISTPLVSFYGEKNISFEGTKEEKERYTAIEELYIKIVAYYEYFSFFKKVDKQGLIILSIANMGKTFDEDIDVKLLIKKNNVCKLEEIPIPGNNIVKELLDLNFIRNYQIKSNDMLIQYTGYPALYIQPTGFLTQENSSKEYTEELKQLFCYEYYEKGDMDILKFHINYLKHNTVMAFPSVLLFKEKPDYIEYEISSKHIEDIIKGTIKIQK